MKKSILIISIYYPPIESIASNRIYSFAKYLDKERFNIFVHTIDEEKDFENDLKGVNVCRVKNDMIFKPLLFQKRTSKIVHYSKVIYNILIKKLTKNIYQKWIDESYRVLKKKIVEDDISVMISSFAPEASHILALKLKKDFPHLKWIADFRDEMSQSPYIDKKTRKRYLDLEKDILKYSDAVTSVSKPILDEFESMYQKNIIFKEIRNGYDFELQDDYKKNSIFTITYTGNFYGDIKPDNFLQALNNFVCKNGILVKLKLVGIKTHFDIPKILEDMVEVMPQVSHDEAIKYLRNSDVLLLIHPSNGRKGVYTGKLFEYLGVMRTIIALVDEDDVAAKLIEQIGAGYVSDNSDIKKIEMILEKAYHEWQDGKKRVFDVELIKRHHRREQVRRLDSLVEDLCHEN